MRDDIFYSIVDEILKGHNINAFWDTSFDSQIDGVLNLDYRGHTEKFYVDIRKEIREYQLHHIFSMAEQYFPFMVVAERLFPNIKASLIEHGVAYIEMNGNINIQTDNILLSVEGKQKKYLHAEKYGRAFTKTGLKALLLFLTNVNDVNDTYREIAGNAGIAIGNVKFILEGLIEEGFVLKLNEKELKLTDKKELLEKWATAYIEKLKPTLYIGNFRFNDPSDILRWKDINLKNPLTQWGGESAGSIYTDYLIPEVLTLYTNEKRSELIKQHSLLPDPNGNVFVYEKFWKDKQPQTNVVPPIIAYADLLATGSKRCIETAQKIYDQFIDNSL